MLVTSIVPLATTLSLPGLMCHTHSVSARVRKKIKKRKSCLKSRKTKGFKHLPEHWMLKIKIEESYPNSIPYFPAPPLSP